MTPVRLLGLEFADVDVPAAAALIAARDPAARFGYVVTPNADHLVRLHRQPALRPIYTGAMVRVLDSRVVARVARLLGVTAPRVCPGSDLVHALLAGCFGATQPITIIGLRPTWLPALRARYGLAALAHFDPPMAFWRDPAALRATVAFVIAHPARFVFLAVGSPGQEILAYAIARSGQATGIGLCVGAALEFLVGARRRAPRWMQRAGLEWLHRLGSEPRRLAGRYLRDDPLIFRLLLRERLTLARQARQNFPG